MMNMCRCIMKTALWRREGNPPPNRFVTPWIRVESIFVCSQWLIQSLFHRVYAKYCTVLMTSTIPCLTHICFSCRISEGRELDREREVLVGHFGQKKRTESSVYWYCWQSKLLLCYIHWTCLLSISRIRYFLSIWTTFFRKKFGLFHRTYFCRASWNVISSQVMKTLHMLAQKS